QEFQTIHNFGASDAWSLQFVGANWPAQKQARIADLLFSLEEQTDGSPVGIGLSAWRFNIGAGSAAQGEERGTGDRWRRADAFLRPDGGFDPSAQPGQRAFLRAARARGVEQFYAFSNSPPVSTNPRCCGGWGTTRGSCAPACGGSRWRRVIACR